MQEQQGKSDTIGETTSIAGGKSLNHIIIKIESGVVADIYFTEPLSVTVVDHDVIEGGETFACRMKKAVLCMTPEQRIRPEEIEEAVRSLVRECRRPRDHHAVVARSDRAA